MRRSILPLAAAALLLAAPAQAATVTFASDPFFGSTALTTPGRQVVGGEPSIEFTIGADVFAFDGSVFPFASSMSFANGLIADIPSTGVNVVVLRTFDNDADPLTPFGAGNAATLIANRLTTPGDGVFIYFNSGLNLARLVYSTDLDDPTADLKILARMTNLTGPNGQLAMQQFGAQNFVLAPVPEPSILVLFGSGAALLAGLKLRQRRGKRAGG